MRIRKKGPLHSPNRLIGAEAALSLTRNANQIAAIAENSDEFSLLIPVQRVDRVVQATFGFHFRARWRRIIDPRRPIFLVECCQNDLLVWGRYFELFDDPRSDAQLLAIAIPKRLEKFLFDTAALGRGCQWLGTSNLVRCTHQMIQRLLPSGAMPELTDPSGQVVIAEVPLAEQWIGRSLTDVEDMTGARVAYITRLGQGELPRADTVVQQGDLVHLALRREDLARVERICDQPPVLH